MYVAEVGNEGGRVAWQRAEFRLPDIEFRERNLHQLPVRQSEGPRPWADLQLPVDDVAAQRVVRPVPLLYRCSLSYRPASGQQQRVFFDEFSVDPLAGTDIR